MEYYYEYLKEGFAVGFVVSVTFVTATFMSYYFFIWLHVRTHKIKNKTPSEAHRLIHRLPSHQISNLEQRGVARMSFDEIKKATNDFSGESLIGVGKTGATFKAALANGVLVAVKRLNRADSEKHLASELKSAGRLRHDNLVPLLGLCTESDGARESVLLVYKYMANGNLHDRLHPRKEGDAMQWSLRLKIGVGVARALAWLHHRSALRLAHLNITSACVLLDRDFVPNISNFSGAIFVDDGNDLDYLKRDVYSFGILLLEIIASGEERAQTESSSVADRLSERLSSQAHRYRNDVLMALRVALDCLNPAAGQRPNMVQVYESLREIESEN